jgi:hypothetical protein
MNEIVQMSVISARSFSRAREGARHRTSVRRSWLWPLCTVLYNPAHAKQYVSTSAKKLFVQQNTIYEPFIDKIDPSTTLNVEKLGKEEKELLWLNSSQKFTILEKEHNIVVAHQLFIRTDVINPSM